MAKKRPCPACGRIDHPLRDCAFRNFYEAGQDKASSGIPITKMSPISYAHRSLVAPTKRQVAYPLQSLEVQMPKSSPLALCSETSPVSYAHRCLMAPKKRQVAYPLRLLEVQMPKSSPLALYSETSMSTQDAIDTTPITGSTILSDGTGGSKPV